MTKIFLSYTKRTSSSFSDKTRYGSKSSANMEQQAEESLQGRNYADAHQMNGGVMYASNTGHKTFNAPNADTHHQASQDGRLVLPSTSSSSTSSSPATATAASHNEPQPEMLQCTALPFNQLQANAEQHLNGAFSMDNAQQVVPTYADMSTTATAATNELLKSRLQTLLLQRDGVQSGSSVQQQLAENDNFSVAHNGANLHDLQQQIAIPSQQPPPFYYDPNTPCNFHDGGVPSNYTAATLTIPIMVPTFGGNLMLNPGAAPAVIMQRDFNNQPHLQQFPLQPPIFGEQQLAASSSLPLQTSNVTNELACANFSQEQQPSNCVFFNNASGENCDGTLKLTSHATAGPQFESNTIAPTMWLPPASSGYDTVPGHLMNNSCLGGQCNDTSFLLPNTVGEKGEELLRAQHHEQEQHFHNYMQQALAAQTAAAATSCGAGTSHHNSFNHDGSFAMEQQISGVGLNPNEFAICSQAPTTIMVPSAPNIFLGRLPAFNNTTYDHETAQHHQLAATSAADAVDIIPMPAQLHGIRPSLRCRRKAPAQALRNKNRGNARACNESCALSYENAHTGESHFVHCNDGGGAFPSSFHGHSGKTDFSSSSYALKSTTKGNLCKICGKIYARPSTLKTHLRTHSGERPYQCSSCLKTFTQAANLTAHMRTHSGEKPFTCPICTRHFSQSSSVTTHLRTHNGERPYKCHVCRKTFSDSSTLTKHMRTHSGEKPYKCQLCAMRFSQSGNLNRHMKIHLQQQTHTKSRWNFAGLPMVLAAAAAAAAAAVNNRNSGAAPSRNHPQHHRSVGKHRSLAAAAADDDKIESHRHKLDVSSADKSLAEAAGSNSNNNDVVDTSVLMSFQDKAHNQNDTGSRKEANVNECVTTTAEASGNNDGNFNQFEIRM